MFGTVLMMTEERKYEFGVLISIGMSRLRLFGIILCETIILSMIGVLLAIIVTYPICYYYNLNPIDMAILMGDGADQMIEEMGYKSITHGQKGHYGVSLLYKKDLIASGKGFESDTDESQKRFVWGEFKTKSDSIFILNGYFPQGEERKHPIK